MFSRLNFLLATAALTILVFYVLGWHVLFKLISALAPDHVSWFAAVYTLATLMLTVLIVAKVVIRLAPLSSDARTHPAGMQSLFAQALLLSGHAGLLGIVYTIFTGQVSDGMRWLAWLATLAGYGAGLVLCVVEWKTRLQRDPG